MTNISNDRQSLRDIAFKAIRNDILTEKLVPGERLMEKNLADKLGISRTPVREALSKLEQEGFVSMTPRIGATVSVICKKNIEDVLKIRAELECLAIKLACQNIDEESLKKLEHAKHSFEKAVESGDVELMAKTDTDFHYFIFSLSENDKLIQIINNLREQIYRYRVTYLKDKRHRMKIVSEHDSLFCAIKANNSKSAQRMARDHIENQERAIIKALDT